MAETELDVRPGTNPVVLAMIMIGAAVTAWLLAARAAHVWQEGAGAIDRTVELLVEAGATVCAGWIAVGAAVGLLYRMTRHAGREWHAGKMFLARCAPGLVRRAAGVVVTASVGLGVAAPGAFAAPASVDPGGTDPAGVVVDLGWQPTPGGAAGDAVGTGDRDGVGTGTGLGGFDGGRVGGHLGEVGGGVGLVGALAGADVSADAPGTGTARPGSGRARDPERDRTVEREARDGSPQRDDVVLVGRNDTLWSIVGRHLASDSPGARAPRAARIAREVVAWHAANRGVIGDDPDLIQPGTVLHAPNPRPLGARS
ncbi:hypothetical protein [Myceligenerans cantabricum]